MAKYLIMGTRTQFFQKEIDGVWGKDKAEAEFWREIMANEIKPIDWKKETNHIEQVVSLPSEDQRDMKRGRNHD